VEGTPTISPEGDNQGQGSIRNPSEKAETSAEADQSALRFVEGIPPVTAEGDNQSGQGRIRTQRPRIKGHIMKGYADFCSVVSGFVRMDNRLCQGRPMTSETTTALVVG
jgi:hypothetical protein